MSGRLSFRQQAARRRQRTPPISLGDAGIPSCDRTSRDELANRDSGDDRVKPDVLLAREFCAPEAWLRSVVSGGGASAAVRPPPSAETAPFASAYRLHLVNDVLESTPAQLLAALGPHARVLLCRVRHCISPAAQGLLMRLVTRKGARSASRCGRGRSAHARAQGRGSRCARPRGTRRWAAASPEHGWPSANSCAPDCFSPCTSARPLSPARSRRQANSGVVALGRPA